MRQSQHTEFEIHDYLGRANAGTSVAEVCAMACVTPRTFYRWRTRYGGVTPQAQRMVKDLQLENSRLRALVASLSARVTTCGPSYASAPEAVLRRDHGGGGDVAHAHQNPGASLGRFARLHGAR